MLVWTPSAALVVIVVTLGLKFFGRGMMSVSAVLLGLIAGYFFALATGMLTFEAVSTSWDRAAVFALPQPFKYGFEFSFAAVLGFCLMAFVSAVETVGDVSGITKGGAMARMNDRRKHTTTAVDQSTDFHNLAR